MRGLLEALREAAPRIRIVEPEPGPPSPGIIWSPGTFPLSMSWVETTAPRLSSSLLTATIEPVMSSFFTVPYPITTTSSRNSASSSKVSLCGTWDALKVCVLYPMQLISTMASAPDTLNSYSPSRPVEVPLEVPCSTTVAPTMGPTWSKTNPLTSYPLCADTGGAIKLNSNIPDRMAIILFIKNCVWLVYISCF